MVDPAPRILHISHSLDTGGGPLYIKKIVDDLPEFNHYVIGNQGYFFNVLQNEIGREKTFLLRNKNILVNCLIIHRIVRQEKISILHCHGRGAGLYGRLVKIFNLKLKIIYTIHGFHPDTLNTLNRILYLRMERFFLRLTNKVILVSETEYQRFTELIGSPPNKLIIIPNYLRVGDYEPIELEFKLDKSFINLIYIGRFSQEKGIDILLNGFISLKRDSVRLYLIGYGEMEKWIIDSVEEHSLKNNIFLLGKMEQASRYLSNFDAVVVPSRYEGMPFIVLEAMLYKIPIIATPSVGTIDLISSETSFMSTDFTPHSLRDAIGRFIETINKKKDYLNIITLRNYENLSVNFSESNIYKLQKLYNDAGL